MATSLRSLHILDESRWTGRRCARLAFACAVGLPLALSGAEVSETTLQELLAANHQLRAIVESQQQEITALRGRVDRLDQTGNRQAAEVTALRDRLDQTPRVETESRAGGTGKLVFSGEAGAAFFAGQRNAHYNNAEFRIDEATLRLEAEAAPHVYLAGEIQLAKRETRDETFHLGEFYVEFENLGGTSLPEGLFNVRLGRVDIPFGEEYLHRDLLTNPLITHSISDLWGTDEGIELFGTMGRASYALAVQNGNAATLRDYSQDKSVTFRLGFDPTPQLHLSASYFRLGDLDATKDFLSEMWIGNIAFRSIGSTQTTRFAADIAELDATWSWDGGHVWGAIGRAGYNDNDPLADNGRDFDYHQIEVVHDLTARLYGAVRYSSLAIDQGFPISGIGAFGKYFFGAPTTKLRRLSVGGGYRFNPAVLFKLEYAFERGELLNGATRGNSDLFSAEAVVGF